MVLFQYKNTVWEKLWWPIDKMVNTTGSAISPKNFQWKDGIFIMKQGQGIHWCATDPDSKVHGANMGPTWVLSAPDRPHEPYYQGKHVTSSKLVSVSSLNPAKWGIPALHHRRAISVRVNQLCDYLPHREQWQLWKYRGANGLVMAMCRPEWEEGKPVKTIVIYFTELKTA